MIMKWNGCVALYVVEKYIIIFLGISLMWKKKKKKINSDKAALFGYWEIEITYDETAMCCTTSFRFNSCFQMQPELILSISDIFMVGDFTRSIIYILIFMVHLQNSVY